jgi:hypothetical protein
MGGRGKSAREIAFMNRVQGALRQSDARRLGELAERQEAGERITPFEVVELGPNFSEFARFVGRWRVWEMGGDADAAKFHRLGERILHGDDPAKVFGPEVRRMSPERREDFLSKVRKIQKG